MQPFHSKDWSRRLDGFRHASNESTKSQLRAGDAQPAGKHGLRLASLGAAGCARRAARPTAVRRWPHARERRAPA